MFNSLMSCWALVTSKRSPHTYYKPNGNEKAKGKALVCCHGCFLANLEKQSVTTQKQRTQKRKEKAKEKRLSNSKMKKETQ